MECRIFTEVLGYKLYIKLCTKREKIDKVKIIVQIAQLKSLNI